MPILDELKKKANGKADGANNIAEAIAQMDFSEGSVTPEEIAESVSAYLDEHLTNPTNPPIDTSLSIAGAAADAKETGDKITQLKEELTAVTERRNVLPFIVSQKTIYGVLVRYDNGKLTVAGTATGDGGRHTHIIEFTLPAGTYAISKYSVENSGTVPPIFVQTSNNTIIGNYGSTTNTFTLASETLLNFGVNVVNGNTYNYSCDLQIESGSTPTMYIPPSGSAYDMVARDDISKQQTEIVRIGNTTRNSINPYGITLVQNKYINCNNGNVGASYAFSHASEEYIPVAPLSHIDFSDYANTTHPIESVVGLAFYDNNNHFISGISYSEYSDEIHATVPANASKMRITVYNDSIDTFVLKRDNVNSLINLYEPYDENPLVTIKETAGMLSIFHTVGCIGDSLASGESAYKTDGVTHYVDLYQFSWGQCLARMTGNTYYNFSRGGLSAKTWLTSEYATTAFDGNHKCDAYIIGLGQNDKNQGYTVGTTADINLSDYTQNADTFCGNYGKIIQMIQEHQPKAKIFVITDPLEGVNTYGINTAIRNVAALFSNVYVLDFYAYGANYLTNGFLHDQYRSGHFNALGYQYVARMIASYIDWYVMNHYSDFSQVEFIGTEYSW